MKFIIPKLIAVFLIFVSNIIQSQNDLDNIVMLFISTISLAQQGQKWATGGNANGTGDFLGTTNNFSIDFKTNNTLKMVLGTDGILAEFFGQSILKTTLLENDIFLSPNPSSGIFNLILPKQKIEPMDINIYNASLQYMKTITSEGIIDIQTYPNGIYFIEFIINGYKTVRKAVKV
ncbi:MAG: T9SS type A sorting domain-containing protein [Bacteroidetes bacterium]|nr:T9SS type A sorting domain-containing protein [Bacteroidota bacterium]